MSDWSELTNEERALLTALARAETAWVELNELPGPCDPWQDLISDLEIRGWVETWDLPEGLFVLLSNRAAEQLGLVLVEIVPEGALRWSESERRTRIAPEPGQVQLKSAPGDLGWLIDPVSLESPHEQGTEHPTESQNAALDDRASTKRTSKSRQDPSQRGYEPRPRHLIGSNLSPWPGPGDSSRKAPCPSCGGSPLPQSSYCLVCDRSSTELPGIPLEAPTLIGKP